MFTPYRWAVGTLMFLAGMINYLDRSALGVAAPFIARDLQLDPAQLGIVFSSFSFGYAAFCFVGGYAADRFGPKAVLTVSMTAWSVFCGLTAVAWSVGSLLAIRILFGMGEGPIGSTFNKAVRNWFPHRQQASAVSFANAGTPLGAALSGSVVGFLAIAVGWRFAFVAIALIGLFWMVMATDRPDENLRVGVEERAELAQGQLSQPSGGPTVALSSLILRPSVLATAFAFFGYSCILFFFINWFPTYLTMARHLSVKDMAFATMIPWVLGFIGLAAGGPLCDLIFRLTGNPLRARKLVLVTACWWRRSASRSPGRSPA